MFLLRLGIVPEVNRTIFAYWNFLNCLSNTAIVKPTLLGLYRIYFGLTITELKGLWDKIEVTLEVNYEKNLSCIISLYKFFYCIYWYIPHTH
jgi:hypothetical protein